MFPKSGQISATDTLQYNSPGENHLTTSPTRVFPDLQQILDNNTNAETGACPDGPIAPPVPGRRSTECFAEFLPTADYVGFAGVERDPALAALPPHGARRQGRRRTAAGHDAAARDRDRAVPRHGAEHGR